MNAAHDTRRREYALVPGGMRARRLPLLRLSWLEDSCEGRRRSGSPIIQPGYRKGQKPPNFGRRYPPEPLSENEAIRLLDQCDISTKRGCRNRALLALLWRTGLRVSEALNLRPHHIDFDGNRVTVLRGKGGKRRTVAIDHGALVEVSRWMVTRSMLRVPADAPLFCTVNRPRPGRRVHGAYVRELCRDLGRRAGIPKRVHPHGLRHSMACDLIREGFPLPYVQSQLGHSSPGTTGVYLRGMGADEAFDQLSRREWPGGSA